MINIDTFKKEHIDSILKDKKCDPQFLEKSIFAFGLLEALVRSNAKFVFKGGTSLMLLLDKPMRLSTDIDIVVSKEYDIEKYIKIASKTFPFKNVEYDERRGKNGIIKKHFRFIYDSPLKKGEELDILLDVLFEDNNYSETLSKEINSEFLIISEPKVFVNVPTVDSILGDKLTAFAPNTIGIKYDIVTKFDNLRSKRVEVIKQLFDIACLLDKASDFIKIKETYLKVSTAEIGYRDLQIDYKDCLLDSFRCALSLFSKGRLFDKDYKELTVGVKKIGGYIYGTKLNLENIYQYAVKVMFLSAGILANKNIFEINNFNSPPLESPFNKINFMEKINKKSYEIAKYSINLIRDMINSSDKT